MSRVTTRVWTLPSVKKKFNSVDEEKFWKYVTYVSDRAYVYYVGLVPDDVLVILLTVPIQSHEGHEEKK